MIVLTIAIQWLHVILGIIWFGGNLYTNLVVIPSIARLPMEKQQEIGGVLGPATARVMTPVSILVVLIGLLRGTAFGSLHSVAAVFGSPYGITWLASLLLGIGLILWGEFVLGKRARMLNTAKTEHEFAAVFDQLKILAPLEILGFVAIFTCMILMRFSL